MAATEMRITAMTAAYLDDLRGVTAEEIIAGYETFRREGSSYPPSGPELRKHAMDARADAHAAKAAEAPRIAPRENNPTPAERQKIGQGLAALKAELQAANAMDRLRGRA